MRHARAKLLFSLLNLLFLVAVGSLNLKVPNDAGSCVSNTPYWENLVLVVVLVSETKALYLQ